ncbi:DUF1904 family protein [Brevibacillus fulvus]|uniref:DUF1904 domain-containing protein n=1 Tax=Brevibacillus fulvus TaxID=1125967 RepID=A0A938Y3B4_9BACL|nr:DUF1904 family protein [Brevibacillus fulvus]MBM7590455.1 hypothetical protein [Brevibacillus fulvus]
MPFLRFKGVPASFLTALSPQLVETFAAVAEVRREVVKVELLPYERITDSPVSLEIYMFQREQGKHDAIAAAMHRLLLEHGYPNAHIFFVILSPSLYYKEGKPLTDYPLIPAPLQNPVP